MNKEELIRNLRYTEKKHRNDIVNTFDTDISMMCSDVLKVLENCIEIPNGATNGDMVEMIFGKDIYCTLIRMMYSSCCEKLKKWWNAPYKRSVEE